MNLFCIVTRDHDLELAGADNITAHCQTRLYACTRQGCTATHTTEYHPEGCTCPVPDPIRFGRRWGDKWGLA